MICGGWNNLPLYKTFKIAWVLLFVVGLLQRKPGFEYIWMSLFNELGGVWSRVRRECTAINEILTNFKLHNYFQSLPWPSCY